MRSRSPFRVVPVRWREAESVLADIRRRVFVEEQGVPPALEWDGRDESARHVLALTGRGEPVGCARLLPHGHIGRMAVLPAFRRRGVGAALLATLVEGARSRGRRKVFLHAQLRAVPFYREHGFRPVGPVFLDAGIPHRYMFRYLDRRAGRGRPSRRRRRGAVR
jgi:predicted GNAT family N-acyltransferase